MTDFTEEQALKMEKALDHFLIRLEDNEYGIRFNGGKLRDIENGTVYQEYYPYQQLLIKLFQKNVQYFFVFLTKRSYLLL